MLAPRHAKPASGEDATDSKGVLSTYVVAGTAALQVIHIVNLPASLPAPIAGLGCLIRALNQSMSCTTGGFCRIM